MREMVPGEIFVKENLSKTQKDWEIQKKASLAIQGASQ